MKFDFAILNPPYGNDNMVNCSKFLHYDFTNKCTDIANETYSLMPDSLIKTTSENEKYKHYKKLYDSKLKYLEELKNEFENVSISEKKPISIWHFVKDNENKIKIKYIDNTVKEYNSLFEISRFTEYEEEFVKYLKDYKRKHIYISLAHLEQKRKIIETLRKYKQTNYLTVNTILCPNIYKWFTSLNGKTYTIDNIDTNEKRKFGVLLFDKIEEAEICGDALRRPLMLFVLYRLKEDQNHYRRFFDYVPYIDWTDERAKTDEGILELCGLPKEKCVEFANYCRNITKDII